MSSTVRPVSSRAARVSATEFDFRVSYTFRIGNHAYYWWWAACTQDAVTKDGVGLPGHHDCGAKRFPSNIPHLG
jgi:hypothetical protein